MVAGADDEGAGSAAAAAGLSGKAVSDVMRALL